jgi:hypothetical protein
VSYSIQIQESARLSVAKAGRAHMSRSPEPQGAPCVYAYKRPRPCPQNIAGVFGFLFCDHWVETNNKDNKDQKAMSVETRVLVASASPLTSNLPIIITRNISFYHRIWPVGGLVIAAIVNVSWMGFLGYWFFKLVEPAFF